MKDNIIISALVVLIAATFYGIFQSPIVRNLGEATRICTVTHSVANIGDDVSTQVLAKSSRQWAVIQQPANATNTVALRINASSTVGTGFTLNPDTGTDTASSTDYFKFGFATEFPTSGSVEAITNTGSSTLNVIECK